MTPNPFLYAGAAAAYIGLLVLGISSAGSFFGPEESILIPMAMLSLFVLSAAVMGFLFLYQPFTLYFEDRKREALLFFGKTVGTFAFLTILFATIATLVSFA
ncbi:MAG TPA: hypothetical protein VFY28_01845 [Candidatus Paceibacterota bacterium]|nr:hypothetical protein [Candidatus Paceibacterota bacterium]